MNPHVVDDESAMRRALELAARGLGHVEPNPCVGAVIVDGNGGLLGQGWHRKFGAPHAEVEALNQAGESARGATLHVTLEPCAHHGKTPPCAEAVIAAGISRVVIGTVDPAPHNAGRGIAALRAAGIAVETGVCESEARELIAPFATLFLQQRPFVLAKWAMTLDGRVATRTGSSQWITGESARRLVHELRGRMDAILTGIGTVLADNPQLTARPPGPRVATRIVLDRRARIPLDSELVRTAGDVPVIVVTTHAASAQQVQKLEQAGVEVLRCEDSAESSPGLLRELLAELGRRRMTNLLLEAGPQVLGAFCDQRMIDEVHGFIAPKIVGGAGAPGPIGGRGIEAIHESLRLASLQWRELDGDMYVTGRISWPAPPGEPSIPPGA